MDERFFPGSNMKIRYDLDLPEGEEEWRKGGREVTVGGKSIRLYTIGEFAQALERSSQTLRLWESKGVLPRATFVKPGKDRNPQGKRRLYSEGQVEGTVKIAREMGLIPFTSGRNTLDLSAFGGRVLELFRRLARGEEA